MSSFLFGNKGSSCELHYKSGTLIPSMSVQPVFEEMLQQLGLLKGEWCELAAIDAKCATILENKGMLEALPKRVRGKNIEMLTSKVALTRRKTLLGLARRLAREMEGAIIRRRFQKRINSKTVSIYSYRYIT